MTAGHRPPSIADGTVSPHLVATLRTLIDEYGLAGVRRTLADPDLAPGALMRRLDPQALAGAIADATGRNVLELTVTQAQDTQDTGDGPNATLVAGLEHPVTVTAILGPQEASA